MNIRYAIMTSFLFSCFSDLSSAAYDDETIEESSDREEADTDQ